MSYKIYKEEKPKVAFSKQLVKDIRTLLWIVTISGIALAFICIEKNYTGSLPWISAMVGLPWTAHGFVCSFYLSMAKSDHSMNGLDYLKYMTENGVNSTSDENKESPAI